MKAALSPSRANDFQQCPLLYRFRVLDKLPEPPSAAANRGTLVHSVLENLFDLPGSERDLSAAVSMIPSAWQKMVDEKPQRTELTAEMGLTAWFTEAEKLISQWFHMENPQQLQPVAREEYVKAVVEGVELRGFVDRIDQAPDGRVRLVDYKTGKAPAPRWAQKAHFQMQFYGLVVYRSRQLLVDELMLVYLGNSRFLRYSPTREDLERTEKQVLSIWDEIVRTHEKDDWRPRKSRLCDWCNHQALCPAFGGTPPELPE